MWITENNTKREKKEKHSPNLSLQIWTLRFIKCGLLNELFVEHETTATEQV